MLSYGVAVALSEKLGLDPPKQESTREGYGHLSPHALLQKPCNGQS